MTKYISFGKSSIGTTYKTKEDWLNHSNIQTTGIEIPHDDVEKIIQAMDLLGLDIWEIRNEAFGSDEGIKQSPLLIEKNTRMKQNRENKHAEMIELLKRYNDLPSILSSWTLGSEKKFFITLERTEGTYNPNRSSRINSYLDLKSTFEGNEYRIWFSNYVTSDGRVQKKKLMKENSTLPSDVLEQLIRKLPSILETKKNIMKEYNIG